MNHALTGLLAALLATTAFAQLPANFTNELLFDTGGQPTSVKFLPDGRMLVMDKGGVITISDSTIVPVTPVVYMTVPNVEAMEERGAISLVLDPDFTLNGYFYIYYKNFPSERFRISRFIHLGSSGDAGSEVMIWEDNETATDCCHYGGGLAFGPDGHLFLSTGDEFDGAQAVDLTRAGGKVHRIEADGTVPTSNPFYDGPGLNLDSIWAYGLRNPYSMHWDLQTERLLIAEVGGNVTTTAQEDLHLGREGANYGWPNCEGACGNPNFPTCNCGTTDDPLFTYAHNGGDAAIICGVVYYGVQFPSSYQGAFFYADYVAGEIRYLTFDGAGTSVLSDTVFEPSAGPVVSFTEGPDGALYYTCIDGKVRRIVYAGGNQAPVITQASASVSAGLAPLSVDFDGLATDFETDPVSYLWIFGDGSQLAGQNVSHTYTGNGPYSAYLIASDALHSTVSTAIEIAVGQPPVATITSPLDMSLFRAGQSIGLAASASDPDGVLGEWSYSWDIDFVHLTHVHPTVTGQGGSAGNFPIPTSGHDFSTSTAFSMELTVTDADGLTDVASVTILPDKVDLTFDTVPSGMIVFLDDIPHVTPFVYDTLIDFEHTLRVEEVRCENFNQLIFSAWSDAGAAEHVLVVPDADTNVVATYMPGGPCSVPVTSGLVAFFEADAGVTTSGSTVTSWEDMSGTGNDMTPVGDPKIVIDELSEHAVIRFDGINDSLERTTGVIGFPIGVLDRSIFTVAKYRSGGWGGFSYGNSLCNRTLGVGVAPGGNLGLQGLCAGNDFVSTSLGAGAGWMTHSVLIDGDRYYHYTNGTQIDLGLHAFETVNAKMAVGASLDGLTHVDMDIAEILVYDRLLTEPERLAVEEYLELKYFGAPCAGAMDCNSNGIPDDCELGSPGRALAFDGGGDYVDLPDQSLADDFTFEAWVKLEGDPPAASDGVVASSSLTAHMNFGGGSARLFNGSTNAVVANTPAILDTWTHYTITRSGTSMKIYTNGLPDGLGTWSGVFEVAVLGRSVAGFLDGELDEVRLWDVARSDAEVLSNYDRTVATNSPGLISCWRFDDSFVDQSVRDFSGALQHGTLGVDALAAADDPDRIASSAPVLVLADLDGNGIPDECDCQSTNYCIGAPNAVGPGALITYSGTLSVVANDLVLEASGCPGGEFGIFYYGTSQPNVPFGDGNRCVGGMTARFPIISASGAGTASYAVDYTMPSYAAVEIKPGSSWNFQYWYRDPLGPLGTSFNLSDALNLSFCQ